MARTEGHWRRVFWCWMCAFQRTEPDLSAGTAAQNRCCISHDFISDLKPKTNPPLHPWGNFFHRLWLLSDSCGTNAARGWGTVFHKFLWHGSPNRLEKPNEALQTWDSISGDSPLWSRRTHYVMVWVAVQTFQPQDVRKSDGSVSQQLRPFMSPFLCLDLFICFVSTSDSLNHLKSFAYLSLVFGTGSTRRDTGRHNAWEGTNKLVHKTTQAELSM